MIPVTESQTWQWQSWQGLPYLTCSLLQDWQHGFFTQQFSPRLPEELVSVLSTRAKAYRVRQVHGNRVLTPSEITTLPTDAEFNLPPADAMITEETQQAVWVASADCTPILIGDRTSGRVAAIHAGWRGTAQNIVNQVINRFLAFGSLTENLLIALGPAIAGSVYQVSEEVATQVGASIIEVEDSALILSKLWAITPSPLIFDDHPGRVRLDVRRVLYIQLQQLGIKPSQIAIAPYCTYQQPDYFFSYRRTQEKKVQWSGIVSEVS